jgi:hypothetical protein
MNAIVNEEFVPTVDPDDVKRLWNMGEDGKKLMALHGTNDINQIRAADGTPLYSDSFMRLVDEWAESQGLFYRLTLLAHTVQLSAAGKLAGMHEGKPSDAVFKAFATVPMKLLAPNVEQFPAVRDGRTYSTD